MVLSGVGGEAMQRGGTSEGEAWVTGSPVMNELLRKAVHVCVARGGLGRTLLSGTGVSVFC